MRELAGKTAFVTGGASGIGLALGRAFAEAGMKVMLADIETDALAAAVKSLREIGPEVRGVTCDVADPVSLERAARAAYAAFGNVHVLCNNAGVSGGFGADGIWNVAREDWEWVLGVNFSGVLYGIRQFVPRMLARAEAGHVVNTASVAGLVTSGTGAPYTVSKHAVVALTELLYKDLKARNAQLSASVLCPGWVDTKIIESARNRPQELNTGGAAQATPEQLLRLAAVRGFLKNGFRPEAIADLVLEAIRSDAFYVVPVQPDIGNALATRLEDIRLRRNPTLA